MSSTFSVYLPANAMATGIDASRSCSARKGRPARAPLSSSRGAVTCRGISEPALLERRGPSVAAGLSAENVNPATARAVPQQHEGPTPRGTSRSRAAGPGVGQISMQVIPESECVFSARTARHCASTRSQRLPTPASGPGRRRPSPRHPGVAGEAASSRCRARRTPPRRPAAPAPRSAPGLAVSPLPTLRDRRRTLHIAIVMTWAFAGRGVCGSWRALVAPTRTDPRRR